MEHYNPIQVRTRRPEQPQYSQDPQRPNGLPQSVNVFSIPIPTSEQVLLAKIYSLQRTVQSLTAEKDTLMRQSQELFEQNTSLKAAKAHLEGDVTRLNNKLKKIEQAIQPSRIHEPMAVEDQTTSEPVRPKEEPVPVGTPLILTRPQSGVIKGNVRAGKPLCIPNQSIPTVAPNLRKRQASQWSPNNTTNNPQQRRKQGVSPFGNVTYNG